MNEKILEKAIPNRYETVFATLGPQITERFHDPEAAAMVDPVALVDTREDPARITVSERLEFATVPAIAAIPHEQDRRILLIRDGGPGVLTCTISDPRTVPDWWKDIRENET